MATIMKTLPATDFNISAGQAGIQFDGDDFITPIGDCTISVNKTKEETDIRTNESPDREIVATDVTSSDQTVSIVMRQLGIAGMNLAWGARDEEYIQSAIAVARTQEFLDVRMLSWLQLKSDAGGDVVNTNVTAVEIGGEPGTLGIHYRHDTLSGLVQIIAAPAGAVGTDVEVTFTATAVAAGADRYVYKVFSEQQRRGKLVVRQNNRRGRNRKIVLARISVGGDGEISVIGDSNEPTSITVTGKVERDENQPAGLERGYILDLV